MLITHQIHIVFDLSSWIRLVIKYVISQVYSQEDTSKMPLEIGNALSHDREPVDDPEIRVQALEAIYLITLQV